MVREGTRGRVLGLAVCCLVSCASVTVQRDDWTALSPTERNEALFQVAPPRFLRLRTAIVRFVSLGPQGDDASATAPVLFVHGLAGSMGVYAPMLVRSDLQSKVFAVDLPGFGGSRSLTGRHTVSAFVETLVDFVHAVGAKKVHLVCHSLGGQVCMWLALEHPRLVSTLTLIDAAGTYDPRAFVEHMSRGLLGSVRPEKDALMTLVARGEGTIVPHVIGFDPLMTAAFSSFDENLGIRVRELAVPTLIVWGEHDELFGIDVALSLKENIAGSELHVVPDGDHSPQISHPDLVLGWLASFLARNGQGLMRQP